VAVPSGTKQPQAEQMCTGRWGKECGGRVVLGVCVWGGGREQAWNVSGGKGAAYAVIGAAIMVLHVSPLTSSSALSRLCCLERHTDAVCCAAPRLPTEPA
jgi:hypothetical protein